MRAAALSGLALLAAACATVHPETAPVGGVVPISGPVGGVTPIAVA